MSPRAERIETERPASERGGFFIRLDTPEEFDPLAFDELVKELITSNSPFPKDLRYIVRGEEMVVFTTDVSYAKADRAFKNLGLGGELRSAGQIRVKFGSEGVTRRLYGVSFSLLSQLPVPKSVSYQQSVLREKLGRHFNIG